MIHSDILIIGSGISGLSYAIKVAEKSPETNINIVTKNEIIESNTKYAQGGISIVLDEKTDSFKKHIDDTLLAGDGLCDEKVVKFVVEEAPERFKELVAWGGQFDKNEDGSYNLGKEGGHTASRVVHNKDITGYEIEKTLIEKIKGYPNIKVFEYHYTIDLITEHHIHEANIDDGVTCFGAYILDMKTKEIKTFISKVVNVAMGGGGQVYQHTTNPLIATGDGIGLAYRAKARIKNMQFYQFHPTALYGVSNPVFLISEAVRGFGAKLRTQDGEKFMHKYDPREELASRDIVARAIDNEIKISGDHYVCLDCRDLPREEFLKHFPNIYERCMSIGIDCFKDLIPVIPAAHYMCGGIDIDEYGQTSLENMFAIGEVTCSGLHGANRLASNSLLEGIVFSKLAIEDCLKTNFKISCENYTKEIKSYVRNRDIDKDIKNNLRKIMWENAAIVRDKSNLEEALTQIETFLKEDVGRLLFLRLLTAKSILQAALQRKESLGAHYLRRINV